MCSMSVSQNQEPIRNWTLCIVFDPNRCQRLNGMFDARTASHQLLMTESDNLLGSSVRDTFKIDLNEYQIKQDSLQTALASWAFHFIDQMGALCLARPRFLELRPPSLLRP